MHRTSVRALLLVAASALVTQIGCVFSAPAAGLEAVAEPSPEERLTELEAEVMALEGKLTAAQAGTAVVLTELSESRAAAMSAEDQASEARAESARAQAAAAAAEIAAREARAEISQARAAAAAAETALAEAIRASRQPEFSVMLQDLQGRRVELSPGLDLRMANLDSARVSVAGPDSVYLAGIRYGSQEFTARLHYPGLSAISDLDLATPALEVVAPDALVVSNVGIGGAAYAVTLRVGDDGAVSITRKAQGHKVRTAAELLRDDLISTADMDRVVRGFGGGTALPGEGVWSTAVAGTVSQTDTAASHAKFVFRNVAQPKVVTLYGITARAAGGTKAGYGLHFLASGTPHTGNTWNFGRSYLLWATQEPAFYGTDDTQIQLYESQDGNRLVWRKSRSIEHPLSAAFTLEALYDPDDCMAMMGTACHGSITVLVDGTEQFKVAVSAEIAQGAADSVALRVLGGPAEFTDLYVLSR